MIIDILTKDDLNELENRLLQRIEKVELGMMNKDRLLSVREMAKQLGIAESTVHKLIPELRLYGAFKMGGIWRISAGDLDAYLRHQKKK